MRFLLATCLFLSALQPRVALAAQGSESLDDIRLRPSYLRLFNACKNASDFHLNSYYEAYVQSLTSTLAFISLSENGVKGMMASKGVSPYMHALLENPTTPVALLDCMGDSDDSEDYIRNMLIADSTGKVVAVSIGVVAVRGGGKLMGGAMNALKAISPTLARRVMIATIIASSAFAYSEFMKERKKKEELAAAPAPDIEAAYSQQLVTTATEQLKKLQELASQELSDEDRALVEREIHNWTLVLEQFSPKTS